jgi:hypothetical protein
MPSSASEPHSGWPRVLALALLLGGFLVVVLYLLDLRVKAGKGLPAYSSYSEEDDGLAESAFILDRLGWTPVPLTQPAVPGLQRGLLILAEPGPGELGDGDARALLRWVEAGNTLLLAGFHETPLHKLLDLRVRRLHIDGAPVVVAPELPGPYTDGIDHLQVDPDATVDGPRAAPMWSVKDGPGALMLLRGKGKILVLADPTLLTNAGLRQQDNVVLLTNVARLAGRDDKVYFDEYHHGLRSAHDFWGYLGYHQQQLTMLPIALLVGAAVWRAMVRLGPAVPTPRETRADAVDYASALARIYEQTGAHRLLARTLIRGFLGSLTQFLRIRRNALPAEILAAWRLHDAGPSMTQLQGLLRGVAALRKDDIPDRELLAWAQAFDKFQQQVMHGG